MRHLLLEQTEGYPAEPVPGQLEDSGEHIHHTEQLCMDDEVC